MRINTDCACGACFTLDDGGNDDPFVRSQFDARHAAWNALHKACPETVKEAAATAAAETAGRIFARIRGIADFPNRPGEEMAVDLMGRLEAIWHIANACTQTPIEPSDGVAYTPEKAAACGTPGYGRES